MPSESISARCASLALSRSSKGHDHGQCSNASVCPQPDPRTVLLVDFLLAHKGHLQHLAASGRSHEQWQNQLVTGSTVPPPGAGRSFRGKAHR